MNPFVLQKFLKHVRGGLRKELYQFINFTQTDGLNELPTGLECYHLFLISQMLSSGLLPPNISIWQIFLGLTFYFTLGHFHSLCEN